MNITTLREELESLPEDRRKKIEEGADALIAEEMTLRGSAQGGKSDAGPGCRDARDQPGERIAARTAQRSADFHARRIRRSDGRRAESGGGVSGPPADHADRNSGSGGVSSAL